MPELAIMDEAPEEITQDNALSLSDILAPNINLADHIEEHELNKIGQRVIKDVAIDEKSREDWCKRYDRWLNIALQVREPKNSPWPGASNVKYPVLTVASIQFQARAYPAIVDGSNLVKGRVLGPDPDGTKRSRADRIAQHMTWQLLYRMPGWEEDTDKLLLMLPITGTVIRKTYYDSIENANCSEMIPAKDFVINYMAKSLETAPRYTHILSYYPYEVQEKVAAGLWKEITVETDEKGDGEDEDALVDFYEQHRTLDLDGDGYPEHYVVTTNKEGEVARIVPCFGAEDVLFNSEAMQLPKPMKLSELMEAGGDFTMFPDAKIVRIARRQYFTKYGFIPSPDGSFYDVGFGSLLDDLTQAIDTTINQMIDAGALQNAQGGFLGDGVQIRAGDKPFHIGEWKRVNVTGGTLRENIVPLALPGPSQVLFNLLGQLVEAAKEITAVQDVMTGEGTANQPATTTLALIEQGQKVMSGIFKRIHRAFGCELRILRRLNRDYLDEEEYFNLTDPQPEMGPDGQPVQGPDGQPQMTNVAQVGREDYADEDLDVIPVSDPTAVSDMQKMARAQALMQFLNDPLVNQIEIRRRFFEAVGERDTKVLLEVPQPPPDPKVVAEAAKIELGHKQLEAKKEVDSATAAKGFMDAAVAAVGIGLIEDAAILAASSVNETDEEQHGEPANGQGNVPGMGEQPSDAGLPQLPQGPPASPDGGMGPGLDGSAGTASAGGPLGPASSDQL